MRTRKRRNKKGMDKAPSLWVFFGRVLIKRDGLRCAYCGCRVLRIGKQVPNQATIDHVTPKSKGGETDLSNLVIACYDCNQKKRDGDALELLLSRE